MTAFFSRPLYKQLFGVDLRTLALLRVMLAISCIVEILQIWPDIFAFFDDRGIFPRKDAFAWQSMDYWSLYYISGHVVWAHLLFCLTLLASLALLLGYRTRLVVFVCWALTTSLSTRLVIFGSGAHMLLPLLLFWSMFLPIGARFSVDAALSKIPKTENSYASAATFAILLQMALLYLFSALLKTNPMWHTTGEAIHYVLHTPDMYTPLGAYLGEWEEVTRFLTLYVYNLELFSIFILFSPIKNAWCRLAILPLLMSLHISFVLFITIGFFPLVCLSGVVVFLPGLFWDKLLPWLNSRPARTGITLYYDEDCGFCRKTCLIFRELGLPPETKVVPAQQFPEVYALMQRDNSWVVEDGKGRRRTRWEAVAWCWCRSPLLWPLGWLFRLPLIHILGDRLYEFIATHRGSFGRLTGLMLPEHEKQLAFRPHEITEAIVFVLIAMVLAWNVGRMPDRSLGILQKPADSVLGTLELEQMMNFFAPMPYHVARWVVIEGHLEDGSKVDVMHDRMTPPLADKPADGYDAYSTHYWYKFYHRVNFDRWHDVLGDYYCRAWQENHPLQPAKNLTFTVYEQETPAPHSKALEIKTFTTFFYDCKKKP